MARLLHRWFVQYNPLYFASALSVLLGVFLLTRDPPEWTSGQLVLAVVIQLYELGLIAGAAFLFNLPGQRRPAVILGLVAIAFLFDVTFRTEALASVGGGMVVPAVVWAMLLATKLALIARALRVRIPALQGALWTLAGVVVALGPQLLGEAIVDRRFLLIAACWIGLALPVASFGTRPGVHAQVALDDWGRTVLERIVHVAPVLWTALYWTHVAAWCGIYELRPTPACFAPLVVLVPFLWRRELATWTASAAALALASTRLEYLETVAVLLAVGLGLKAWRARMPRLYAAAAGAGFVAAWPLIAPWLPKKLAFWGATLLASGFAALAAGVGLNWWSSREASDRVKLG